MTRGEIGLDSHSCATGFGVIHVYSMHLVASMLYRVTCSTSVHPQESWVGDMRDMGYDDDMRVRERDMRERQQEGNEKNRKRYDAS